MEEQFWLTKLTLTERELKSTQIKMMVTYMFCLISSYHHIHQRNAFVGTGALGHTHLQFPQPFR